jgi:hypothetical protein
MKKLLILALALFGSICHGQSVTPTAAYLSSDGTDWSPWTAVGGFGAISYTPPVLAGLYCQASPGAQWMPCVPTGGGGGGASFTPTGIQFATSTTAARIALPADIANLITPQTGCSTAGFVWVPASNTCVAQSGGISGSGTTGFLPVWTGSTSLGNSVIDLGVSSANTLTVQPPNNDSVDISSTGTGITSIIGGANVNINSAVGNVRIQSVASGTTVQVITDGNAQNMSFPSPGFTGTVGILEGPTTALHYVEVAPDGVGLQDGGSPLSPVATTGNINSTTGILPSARVPVNIANGVNFWGNSIIAGTGPQPAILNYKQIFTNLFPVGPAPQNRTLAGTFSADIVNFGALSRPVGSVSTAAFVMPSYNAPLNIIQSLENDANFTTATSANQITYTQTVDMALLALGTAPVDQWNQVTGNSWVFTGGATPTDNFYGSIAPGVLLTTSQTASTTITTVAVPGSTVSEPIDILYTVFASDTGSFNINIDSAACTDTITGASTLPNAPFGGATLETSQGYTRTLALARCVPTSVGSHTVAIVPISGGTNGIGIQAIITSPLSQNNFTGPTAVKVGVMRQQSDVKSTTTALYNTLSINDCNQMLADGFRCINSPAREPYITLNNLAFMMSSTTATQGGAIDQIGMSWTAGNATLMVPNGVNPSYQGKTAICVDGLTASTDLFATVQSVPTSTTLLLSIVSPSAAPGTTVTGTGVCHFGYNDTVTLGSITPGLHPTTAGDDALLRGILSVVQPTMVSPNFQTLQTFNAGFQSTVQPSLAPNILNITAQTPNATVATLPTLNWQILPGGTAGTGSGFGLYGNTTTSSIETFLFSQVNKSVDICDNNVTGSTLNNAFRCGFRFLQTNAAGAGLQMPTEIVNAAQYQTPAVVIAGTTISNEAGLQTITLAANQTLTLGGTALQPGSIITLKVTENATGGFTLTLPAAFVGAPAINTAANAVTVMTFQSTDGTTLSYIGGTGQIVSTGITGGTSGQVPILNSATTASSSKAIAGAGAGLTSGPTSAPSTDVPVFTGTTGGIVDSGIPISSLCQTSGTNCPASSSYSLGGTLSNSNVVVGAGAGTGATAALVGQDGNHLLQITTGLAPNNTALYATVTFTASRGRVTYCLATPASASAAALLGVSAIFLSSGSSTQYLVSISGAALAPSTNYEWDVSCP